MRLHNRQIKATFWNDPDLLQWPRDKRMFYAGLSQIADDSGCLEDSPFAFKLILYPSPIDDDITVEILSKWRDEFIEQGKLTPYCAGGKQYLFMNNFHKHQTLDKPTPPGKASIPLPPWVQWVQGETRSGSKYVVLDMSGTSRDTGETNEGQVEDMAGACRGRTGTGTGTKTNNSFGELFDSCDSVTASGEPIDSQESGEADVQQPKKKRRSKSPSEDAKETARYLREKLESYGVDHFPRDWLLKNYAIADRLLNNIPKADLMACIDWAMAEQFWRAKTNDMLSIERAYMQFRRRSSGENDAGNGSAFGADAEVV